MFWLLAGIAIHLVSYDTKAYDTSPGRHLSAAHWQHKSAQSGLATYWVDGGDPLTRGMVHLSAIEINSCGVIRLAPIDSVAAANIRVHLKMPVVLTLKDTPIVGLTTYENPQFTEVWITPGELMTHAIITHELGHAVLMPHVPGTVMNSSVLFPPLWGFGADEEEHTVLCSILKEQWLSLKKEK